MAAFASSGRNADCGLRLLSAWSVDPGSGLRDFWRVFDCVFYCVAQEIH